jgi:L-ascorbate metabolism protein UlaG (beta-lactamase superfamily)
MPSTNFKSNLTITHIGTATSILEIDGVNILTDPVFANAGAEYDIGVIVLKSTEGPALGLQDLPHIDAVLLSHEDHPDNLDEVGRSLLNGRMVITTIDGAKKLQPRPSVRGIRPWETLPLEVGGKQFKVTGTPCQHVPGGAVTGFILESPMFGNGPEGLVNAIYVSGDTVYLEELAEMHKKFHIAVAVLNLGAAKAPGPDGPFLVTMDGKQAAKLVREIGADIVVPMHYRSWEHFTESGDQLAKAFEEEGIQNKVCWLTPGVPKRVI